MGYDIAVIDKRHRFESRQAFDDFYAKAVNSDNEYDPCDYHNCSPSLQRWFLSVRDVVRPFFTEDSQEDEEIPGTYWGDYDLMPEVIPPCSRFLFIFLGNLLLELVKFVFFSYTDPPLEPCP